MIKRYSLPEMARIWSDENRYLTWLKVEWAFCLEWAKQGGIPKNDFKILKKKVEKLIAENGIKPNEVEKYEEVTKHDVIAFTTAIAKKIGPVSRYIHFGLTSSDVVDTALSILIQQSGAVLLNKIKTFQKILKEKAKILKNLPTIGRSHGIFAEPTSFGLKFLSWYSEWQRNEIRLKRALDGVRFGKLSGAVGVSPHWSIVFEKRVLKRVGLSREPVSTQVIPRDRHAELFNVLAICGGSLERIAVELRHLQRSEVSEILENFQSGQKGSSAMPHKRNPISSENLTGCARLLRAYSGSALENIALWHERDISHSSVERVLFPDAFILFDYALNRMSKLLLGLKVKENQVRYNLQLAGDTVYSGHLLLALVRNGMTREKAYALIQKCALKSIENKESFIDLVQAEPEISKKLSMQEIKKICSINYQLRNVKKIYQASLKI